MTKGKPAEDVTDCIPLARLFEVPKLKVQVLPVTDADGRPLTEAEAKEAHDIVRAAWAKQVVRKPV
jgi:hypothetical protein